MLTRRHFTRLALTAAAALPLSFAAAGTASARTVDLSLSAPHTMSRYPGAGPMGADIPAFSADGARTMLSTQNVAQANGTRWALVHYGTRMGWTSERGTRTSRPQRLPRALTGSLDSLMGQAGPDSGAIVSDRAGDVLWSSRAGTPRILASNTKMFITGYYAHLLGSAAYGLLHQILPPSDNGLADALSVRLGGPLVAERYAASYGASVSIHDGSGLDPADKASPLNIDRYLVGESTDRGFGTWEGALPVAGQSGTLAARMAGTDAFGACHAKTGTLPVQGATALSGYCTARSGRRFVFSILENGVNITTGRSIQDRMLADLTARLH